MTIEKKKLLERDRVSEISAKRIALELSKKASELISKESLRIQKLEIMRNVPFLVIKNRLREDTRQRMNWYFSEEK